MINNKLTILLVEDDSLLAMTESLWLTRAGYSVIHSINGETAIEKVQDKKNEIDLILMDINLGSGIDGTKAAREILKENDIPLLFLSSHTEEEVVKKTEKITSYGYVIKDSKDIVLIASIKMAFKLHQANKELRAKENALEESKRRLQRAELVSKTGHWECHIDSQVIISSEGASKIYGFEKQISDIFEIRKRTLPEYHALLDSAMKNLIEFNNPYDVEFKIIRPTDRKIIDIHSIAEFDKDEKIVFGTIQDVTDQKSVETTLEESEEKFRAIFENNSSAIAIIESDTSISMANNAFCHMSGYTKEEINRMSWTQFLNPAELDRLMEYNSRRKLNPKDAPDSYEFSFYKKNGEFRFAYINVNYIQNNQKIVISIVDITDRKQAEIQLQKFTDELKALNNAKDKFFSIISHDLKNPFHSINAALKLLLFEVDSLTSDERTVFLQRILTTSERAYSLLENLLLWSREQMGNIEFKPEMIEIIEIIIESIKHLEQNAALKNITVTSSVKNNIFVKADRNMIEIVLRNLLANAIKFTGIKGKINIEAIESDGYVRITVIDNGTGILTEDICKLFRIDHLFSTRGTKGEEGTGLGLIICKDFIEKNEGKIWVESEFGKGSKFTFELPRMKSNKLQQNLL